MLTNELLTQSWLCTRKRWKKTWWLQRIRNENTFFPSSRISFFIIFSALIQFFYEGKSGMKKLHDTTFWLELLMTGKKKLFVRLLYTKWKKFAYEVDRSSIEFLEQEILNKEFTLEMIFFVHFSLASRASKLRMFNLLDENLNVWSRTKPLWREFEDDTISNWHAINYKNYHIIEIQSCWGWFDNYVSVFKIYFVKFRELWSFNINLSFLRAFCDNLHSCVILYAQPLTTFTTFVELKMLWT